VSEILRDAAEQRRKAKTKRGGPEDFLAQLREGGSQLQEAGTELAQVRESPEEDEKKL